ncbi:MAG: sugar ABC transporter permease [Clostridia bacterium]|nr:sugar ABC transporter permease [Clostridia bacterium]
MNLQNTVSAPKSGKKKRASSLNARKARSGWWFVSPFIVGFILIYLPILIESITYTFCEVTPLGNGAFETTFVGFENYQYAFFSDAKFVPTLLAGLQTLALNIPMIVIFSLFMAVILNQKMIGRTFFRAVFFIPVVLSVGILENLDPNFDPGSDGISDGSGENATDELVSAFDLQILFQSMKVGEQLVQIVVDAINGVQEIISRSGVQFLIFLTGLQSISPAIYESCQIDGATSWETFWKITLPMISPMILVNAVYTVIDSFTVNNAVMDYVLSYSAVPTDGVSSAMAWTYVLIVVGIIGLVALLLSGYVFYQKRDA